MPSLNKPLHYCDIVEDSAETIIRLAKIVNEVMYLYRKNLEKKKALGFTLFLNKRFQHLLKRSSIP